MRHIYNNNIVSFKIVHCFQPRQRIIFEVEDIHTVVPEYVYIIKCIIYAYYNAFLLFFIKLRILRITIKNKTEIVHTYEYRCNAHITICQMYA